MTRAVARVCVSNFPERGPEAAGPAKLRTMPRRLSWPLSILAGGAIAACHSGGPTTRSPVAVTVTPSPMPSPTPAPFPWTLLVDDHSDRYGPFDPGIRGLGLIYTRVNNGRLELRIEGSTSFSPISGMSWTVFMDTDRNPETGDRVEDIGADFMAGFGAEGSSLRRAVGGGFPLTFERLDRFVEVGLPLDWLGNPAAVDFVFRSVDFGPYEIDQAPDRGHVTLELPRSNALR